MMSLNEPQRQALGSIEDGLAGSDPRLASMLNIFSRLAAGEEMPVREKIRVLRGRPTAPVAPRPAAPAPGHSPPASAPAVPAPGSAAGHAVAVGRHLRRTDRRRAGPQHQRPQRPASSRWERRAPFPRPAAALVAPSGDAPSRRESVPFPKEPGHQDRAARHRPPWDGWLTEEMRNSAADPYPPAEGHERCENLTGTAQSKMICAAIPDRRHLNGRASIRRYAPNVRLPLGRCPR